MPPTIPTEPIYISNFSIGLWSNRSPFSLPGGNPSALLDGLNCEITPQHTIKRRAGYNSLLTATLSGGEVAQRFFSFRQLDDVLRLVVDATNTLKAIDIAAETITTFYTPSTASTPFSFAPVGSMLYFANGKTGEEQKWDGTNQTRWGIVAPTDTPTTAQTAGTLTAARGYEYRFVYKNTSTGHISTASTASACTNPFTSKTITVTGNFGSDGQVDQIEVYRNADGGGIFFKLGTVTNPGSGTWDFVDQIEDSALGTLKAPLAGLNDPPTDAIDNVVFHVGRMWGSVDNIVYYSGGGEILNGVPEEAWSALNFFNFPGKVTALFPFAVGLLVFTESDLFVIRGIDQTSFFAMPWQKRLGIGSNRAIAGTEDRAFIFTTERELLSIAPEEIREVGLPISDRLAAIAPSSVELTLHRDEATDNNLYVSDGNSFFYKMALVDEVWSPRANIIGGLRTLGSVETSAGNFDLLLGRATTILKRSTTVFTDNGTAYAMNMSFGSFVIAPPAQLREIELIILERSSGNTDYSVGVRLNEVGLEYKLLLDKVDDPPLLGSSETARSLRYFVRQMARHLQVQLSLPAEDNGTQLYSLTLVVK
ncbi:hypothetical protein LCGC14_0592990 [marine sediment metagenome]|uniref:Uncharacterized protein n=1 Tax=marine sediment metagenome TaxID=412755 RepID=A0A0F9TZ43_9ZZZZ